MLPQGTISNSFCSKLQFSLLGQIVLLIIAVIAGRDFNFRLAVKAESRYSSSLVRYWTLSIWNMCCDISSATTPQTRYS